MSQLAVYCLIRLINQIDKFYYDVVKTPVSEPEII
jgi:hypothetical protein